MKKNLFKLLLSFLVLGITLGVSSCQANNPGKLICGITIYEPMNYKDNAGNWTGFDTEFANLVGEKLGMDVEFQEIKWESKYSELEAGTINCIWNGFTANSEDDGKKRSEYVDFSYSYMLNQQCVVINAQNVDNFKTLDDLAGKTAAAEKGSAGEAFAKEAVGSAGSMIDSAAQVDTFIEVKAGAVDFAVVDILLAQQLAGTGNYSDLVIADITLDSEVYAVGFKKGSDLTQKVNNAMKELFDEGKMAELAEKYGLTNSLKLDTEFKG
ncbi:MAG: transporter substrate-binding domain-containing protein [Eubacterium sp.]|jgi:polar amino acid transport system substrate-binding protein|nr:transporter substrate-binding domain-containing protein [Eubacterium sp.]